MLGMRVLAALASAQLVGARAMLHLCITCYAMVAALAPPLAEELARVRERQAAAQEARAAQRAAEEDARAARSLQAAERGHRLGLG